MTFAIIPSRDWTESLRQETCNAVNILMMKKCLHEDTNYELFLDSRGRPSVRFWMDYGDGPFAVAVTTAVDIIVAAGHYKTVQGYGDEI